METNFTGADLTGCSIFGVSAWGLELREAKQQDLVITRWDEPEITVDNIEVAQFIYLMLHNQKNSRRDRHHYFQGGADPGSLHR